MIGAACWASHPLPMVHALSFYLLPLGYLNWVGMTLLALAAVFWVRNLVSPGLLKYVRSGEPITGRVCQVGVRAEGTAESPLGRFIAEVEFLHPDSGELQVLCVAAPDTFALGETSRMDAGVAAGDYVTLVYLPGRLEKTLQMYGWMGLSPEMDLIQKDGRPLQPMSAIASLLIVVAVTVAAWMLIGYLYIIGRYTALDSNCWYPYTVGIALCTIPLFILMILNVKANPAKPGGRVTGYGLALLVSVFGGFMIGFPAVGFLNGYFDSSPTNLEPVKVVQLWQETTNGVLRTYQLEYHPYPAGPKEKQTVAVDTLARFKSDSLGAIDVGRGWLGMRWLRDFHPITWDTVDESDPRHYPGEILFQLPGDGRTTRIAPWVAMNENHSELPPEVLVPELRTRMVTYLTRDVNARIAEPEKP